VVRLGGSPGAASPAGTFPGGAFPSGAFPTGAFPGGVFPGGVFIEVADEGPGMTEADAARAFDRFHRAGHTARGGSGLGLSIVAAIAAAHGGRAALRSAPGAGTTVRVELPLPMGTTEE
jgi:signal transduction histidine kinase